jgi:hypothetical protein
VVSPNHVRRTGQKETDFLSICKTPLAMAATLTGIALLRVSLDTDGAGGNGVELCGGSA